MIEKPSSLIPSLRSSAVSKAEIEISNLLISKNGADTSALHGKAESCPGVTTDQQAGNTSLSERSGPANKSVKALRQSPVDLASNKINDSGTEDKDITIPLNIESSVTPDVSYIGDSPKRQGNLLTTTIPNTQPYPGEDSLSSPLQTLIATTSRYLHTFQDFNERRKIWLNLIRTTSADCSTIVIAHEQSELATFFWTYPFSLNLLGSEAQHEWQYHAQRFFRLDKPSYSPFEHLRFSNAVFDSAPTSPTYQEEPINEERQSYEGRTSTKTSTNTQRSTNPVVTSIPSPTDVDWQTADKVSCLGLQTGQVYGQSTNEPYGSRENTSSNLEGAKVTINVEAEAGNNLAVLSRSHSTTDVIVDEMITFLTPNDQTMLGTQETFGKQEGPSRSRACIECRKIMVTRFA